MNASTDHQYRIFNIKAVIEVTALSRSTIYELIKPTSPYYDSSFPKPIHLTETRIGWISQEIYDWLELKITLREVKQREMAPFVFFLMKMKNKIFMKNKVMKFWTTYAFQITLILVNKILLVCYF